MIFGCFSAFHGQRSVAEAGTNPSPWSIRKWYQDVMYVNEELKTEVLEKVILNRMMIFQARVRFFFCSFLNNIDSPSYGQELEDRIIINMQACSALKYILENETKYMEKSLKSLKTVVPRGTACKGVCS